MSLLHNSGNFRTAVRAGMVVGWVHKPAAILVEQAYGRGRLVATTFRLLGDPPGFDPTATVLLDGIVELALKDAALAPVAAARPLLAELSPA